MPIKVFVISSGNKIDTSLFVPKSFLRNIYKESNFEKDIDLKNEFRSNDLLDSISISEACSKNHVDTFLTILV